MAGFIVAFNINGDRPLVFEFTMKDTETLTVGDMLNLESSEVDLAATNDAAMLGPMNGASDPDDNVSNAPGTVSGTDSTTKVKAHVRRDAILADGSDANARLVGVNLDIGGATGAQAVAADSNSDFFTVKDSSAVEDTLVMVAEGEHYLDQT